MYLQCDGPVKSSLVVVVAEREMFGLAHIRA
jgi:hypothetical protein